MKAPLIYKKGPLFGLDVGSHTAKLVQIRRSGKTIDVLAYGHVDFGDQAIVEGVIADPESLATAIKPLLSGKTAKFNARRVATTLPVAKVFSRLLQLPAMEKKDLAEAVRLEAEQAIPIPPTDLYMDYEVIGSTKNDKGEIHTDVLMVAAPRAIVDSYVKLVELLGLEIAAIEFSLISIARALTSTGQIQGPTLMIDLGSQSADLAVFDQVIRLTGTVAVGGDQITQALVKNLGITEEQANEIKYKFGIGPSGLQTKALEAVGPLLKTLISEVNKALKYYLDRNPGKTISNITLTGGSASMPGLVDYLSSNLKIAIKLGNPWSNLNLKHVKALDSLEAPIYATALGLALLEGSHD